MSTYSVKVKWNKETYELDLDTNESPSVFKAQIFALTSVCTSRQKLMFKGSIVKDDKWEPGMLKMFKNGITFLMIGSTSNLPEEPLEKAVFVEDLSEKELKVALDMPTGLINLGNTCYLNATIQSLSVVPELRDCLKKYDGSITMNTGDGIHNMVVTLRDTYTQMEKNSVVIPMSLLDMLHIMFPQFAEKNENGNFIQQDAHECWGELMKAMQQKLKIQNPNGETLNFITQYFGVNFHSTMKLKDNNDESKETTAEENFLQLSCFISQDVKYLQTGLKLKMTEEISKFSPELNCNATYVKTSKISRLPAYLSINFIRLYYKEKHAINAKVLKDVKFSFNLDMYELCTPELQKKLVPMRQKFKEYEDKYVNKMQKDKKTEKDQSKIEYYPYSFEDDVGSNNSGLYQLRAVMTHKGRSSNSGHYVSWIKHKDCWFKCDDSEISEATEEEILKLSGGGDWHCAYVLLYGPQLLEKC